MIGLRVFDVGALIVWLIWFFRLRDDDDDSDDFRGGDGNAPEPDEPKGPSGGLDLPLADSRPWPFPSSLMLGFTAPWRAGEPRRIDAELDDLRWFARAEIAAAAEERDGALGLPPRFAIARRLLEHWVRR